MSLFEGKNVLSTLSKYAETAYFERVIFCVLACHIKVVVLYVCKSQTERSQSE